MVDKCKSCEGTGWSRRYMVPCDTCKGSGCCKPAVFDYNELVPPKNPAFPWKPDGWQLLCYYCAEPIEIGEPIAGYRQRTLFMRGMWRHKEGNLNCVKSLIRADIDPPRCHICGTQTTAHSPICSAGGRPVCYATPMSAKEDELRRRFGWNAKQQEEKREVKQNLETVGAFVVAGALIAAVSWLANTLGQKKTP